MSVTRAARTRYSTPAGLPQRVGRPNQETERELTDRGHDCRHPQALARRRCLGAAERCCIRFADAYDTASLRRPPARRPERIPSPVEHPNLERGPGGDRRQGTRRALRRLDRACVRGGQAASIDRAGVPAIGSRGGDNLKRFIRVGALGFAALLALGACSGGAAAPSDELGVITVPAGEPLHIAYWGVLSGADATLGEDSKRGVEIAIDDKDGKLLDHTISLTQEDGLCTPEGGATAAQKLAADTTLVGLIGSACSDETVGGIKSITDAGLTTISPSNTRPALTAEDRDATYAGYARTAHSDAFQGKAVAEWAFNEKGVKTAATIHD